MENSWAVVTIVSIIAAIFISKLFYFDKNPKQETPPGPKPWPIIGNLNLLIGSIPHQSFHNLSQQYGEIVQLKFGKFPVLVVSSSKMAKQFLKTHDHIFAYRHPTASGKYTAYNHTNILYGSYGPLWRQGRKIIYTEVFKTDKLESFEHIRVEEICKLVSNLHSLSGKPVMIRDHLMRYTLSFTCRMIWGEKFSTEKLDQVQAFLDEWFLLNGVSCIGDWIPWLSFLDIGGYIKKMKALHKKMDMFQDSEIDVRQAKRGIKDDNSAPKGVIDAVLQSGRDPDLKVEMTSDHLKAIVQDLVAGGTDSSSCTTEWAIHEIMKESHILSKAKEELDRVIGRNRWVEEADLSNLPYLNAIVMETFRLHPPVTLPPPHCANEDCIVDGYNIFKGTSVFINLWSIGRDPKTWDRPEEFLPERFLEKEFDIIDNFDVLPFSAGRRVCPGYTLGLKHVRGVLANLLHGFDWKLPEGVKSSTEEVAGLSTHPKHHLAIIMEPTLDIPYS